MNRTDTADNTFADMQQKAYKDLGISKEVLAFAAPILESLKPRFEAIDQMAEYNQLRIIHAMQEAHIGEASLKGTTGVRLR